METLSGRFTNLDVSMTLRYEISPRLVLGFVESVPISVKISMIRENKWEIVPK